MSRSAGSAAWAWGALLIIPTVLLVVLIVPGLGEMGEGILPEVLAHEELRNAPEFYDFAVHARSWAIVILTLSAVVGVLFWLALRATWRRRLLEFDFEQVLNYRRLVWSHFGYAVVVAALIATGLLFCSVDLRRLSPASWIILILAGAITAALQYLMNIWGTVGTRRLFRGR